MRHIRRRRGGRSIVASLTFAALLGSGTYALTAANAVPPTKAGDGTGGVSGYSVSAIKYNLNASNPSNADTVTFTLDAAPAAGSSLKTQVAGGGAWYSCTNSGVNATCTLTGGVAVTSIDQLRVVAAD